jgi:DNA-directed RNA polymerase I subunit RPA2
LEKLALHPPQKEGLANSTRQALYPFECRQAKLTYSGRFSANVCLQYEGDVAIVQDSFSFG